MASPLQPAEAERQIGPGERGWRKLIIALAAFLIVPYFLRALLPIDQTVYLLLPAIAACFLVGWWAGAQPWLAIAWVGLATWVIWQRPTIPDGFYNLERGWSLLLAGSFGLACLFGERRALFARALGALSVAAFLALAMGAMGPVPLSQAKQTIANEYVRRNQIAVANMNAVIGAHPTEWNQWTAQVPWLAEMPAQTEEGLNQASRIGITLFPSLLALESLAALALAWSIYHRLSRARIGAPLRPLREFRFNDQFVWGLIVGLTTVFLPTLQSFRGAGRNLLMFFSALYAVRGLAVLAWFLAPGALTTALTVGFAMLLVPIIQVAAVFGFVVLLVTAFVLGLGDTWADWRRRARPTS